MKKLADVHVTIEPVLIHFFSRTPAFVHVCVFFVFEIDYLISNLHGFFQSQILSNILKKQPCRNIINRRAYRQISTTSRQVPTS